jgi:predicted nucleic acid-binding Zn ribbon protein
MKHKIIASQHISKHCMVCGVANANDNRKLTTCDYLKLTTLN